MLTAILFDLDGTIVNTDPIHYQVWREILLDYDVEIDEKIYQSRFTGRLNPEVIHEILPHLSPEEGEKLAEEKEVRFREKAPQLKPMQGFSHLIALTQRYGIKRALVTNAPTKNAHFMLNILGLEATFDTVVIAEQEAAAKPDPTPYRVALERLGVTPEEAIAFEDSPSGIRSAVGAGIPTIGVASSGEPVEMLRMGVFMTVYDFTDPQMWTFLNSRMTLDPISVNV